MLVENTLTYNEMYEKLQKVESDKIKMQKVISDLLVEIDNLDKTLADESGGLTMHTYGQTPVWYVKAAGWSCFGCDPYTTDNQKGD